MAGWLAIVVVAVAAVGALAVGAALTGKIASAQESSAQEAPPRLVILARSDVPADALASGPVGGVLGAPVLLTPQALLHPAVVDALAGIDPDVVVLAGGPSALSVEVEQAVADLGYATRRAAGADRHETAVLVSALLAEYSAGRPVLTGAPVTDEIIPGLNAERLGGVTVTELRAEFDTRIAALEGTIAGQAGQIADLESDVAGLQGLLAGVTRETVDGHDTVRFSGMNVQVVNGTGSTDGTPDGLGNLIIGYSAQRDGGDPAERTGSHYLIAGDEHEWTAFGGILAGFGNNATGEWASVTGGNYNWATGSWASVTGGAGNTASGPSTSVNGGHVNTATGFWSSVSGGQVNIAGGHMAVVSGGRGNQASGYLSSVSGGEDNTASGQYASVSGGEDNTAGGNRSSILGGDGQTTLFDHGLYPAP